MRLPMLGAPMGEAWSCGRRYSSGGHANVMKQCMARAVVSSEAAWCSERTTHARASVRVACCAAGCKKRYGSSHAPEHAFHGRLLLVKALLQPRVPAFKRQRVPVRGSYVDCAFGMRVCTHVHTHAHVHAGVACLCRTHGVRAPQSSKQPRAQ